MNIEQSEDTFLRMLSGAKLDADAVSSHLQQAAEEGHAELANEWAQLAAETFAERRDAWGMVRLFEAWRGWHSDAADLRETCKRFLRSVFRDRRGRELLDAIELDNNEVSLGEWLRRLTLFKTLKRGILCTDRTWGVGVVDSIDALYGKIVVDFREKKQHEMTLRYALQRLELLPEDHILAVAAEDPQKLKEMAHIAPDELVRTALRSYGPLTGQELKEKLTVDVLTADEWKGFWEKARLELKKDPLVVVPSRQNLPFEILQESGEYRRRLMVEITHLKDPKDIVRLVERAPLSEATDDDPDLRGVFEECLRAASERIRDSSPELLGRALVLLNTLAAPEEGEAGSSWIRPIADRFLHKDMLVEAGCRLPARKFGGVLAALGDLCPSELEARLVSSLTRYPFGAWTEIDAYLRGKGREQAFEEAVHAAWSSEQPEPVVIRWLWRNISRTDEWSWLSSEELLYRIISTAERGAVSRGEDRDLRDLLADLRDAELLRQAMDGWDDQQRRRFVKRIADSSQLAESERRAILGKLITIYPDLKKTAEERTVQERDDGRQVQEITSWRSYREKQHRLKHLIEKEIPENSREIARARSYGDLRENFEYQAAKDHQKLLLQRKQELEGDLKRVQPTDFSRVQTAKGGIGTCIHLEKEGVRRSYSILGAWDHDEELGIIPPASRVGQALMGCREGDLISLSSDTGANTEPLWKVTQVSAIPANVRDWLEKKKGDGRES